MPKIYTKTGDSGQTSMLGGKRVSKSCLEMEAIGEVDELNAFLGILIEEIDGDTPARNASDSVAGREGTEGKDYTEVKKKLINIQHCLFVIGANLASVQAKIKTIPKLRKICNRIRGIRRRRVCLC